MTDKIEAAAREYMGEHAGSTEPMAFAAESAFKAGAHWMAEQMKEKPIDQSTGLVISSVDQIEGFIKRIQELEMMLSLEKNAHGLTAENEEKLEAKLATALSALQQIAESNGMSVRHEKRPQFIARQAIEAVK